MNTSSQTSIKVIQADLDDVTQARAIVRIVDNYARDPMGDGRGLPPDVLEEMIPALQAAPSARIFLAYVPSPWIEKAKTENASSHSSAPTVSTADSLEGDDPPTFPPVPVTYGNRGASCGCSGCGCTSTGPGGYVACGVAVCFVTCSTWAARPAVNVHDLAVDPAYRGRGIGQALLEAVKEHARSISACKVTLEVREDNLVAQKLYKRLGFGEGTVPMKFWICPIED